MADHRSLIARTGHGIGRFRGGRVAPSLGQPGRSLAPVFTWVVKLEHRLIRGSLCCVHNYGQTGRRLVVGLDSPPRSAGSGWCGVGDRRSPETWGVCGCCCRLQLHQTGLVVRLPARPLAIAR